jgi:hypothetical protein
MVVKTGNGDRLTSTRIAAVLGLEESSSSGSGFLSAEVIALISKMSQANPGGAPRMHGELLKLAFPRKPGARFWQTI